MHTGGWGRDTLVPLYLAQSSAFDMITLCLVGSITVAIRSFWVYQCPLDQICRDYSRSIPRATWQRWRYRENWINEYTRGCLIFIHEKKKMAMRFLWTHKWQDHSHLLISLSSFLSTTLSLYLSTTLLISFLISLYL